MNAVEIGARPAISVVIPSYNSAWSIERTILSVIAQRFTDWEAIVIDDGSTDALGEVLAPLLAAEPRLRVVRQENRGLAGARNRGIAEAAADLVAPLDADDIWHPDFLAETHAALASTAAAPFAYTYSFRMLIDDTVMPFVVPTTPPRHDLEGMLNHNSVGSGSAALYRKSELIAAGMFDEEMGRRQLHGAEDWKLALRLTHRGTPVLIERHLVGYRLVDSSMSQKDPARQLRAIRAVLDDMQAELPDVPKQAFRDGNTMMTMWLLPTFALRGEFGYLLREAVAAYGANPLWIMNPVLRQTHYDRIRSVLRTLGRVTRIRPDPYTPLRELELYGERPFHYMPEGALVPG